MKNKSHLSPELQRKIQEQAIKNKYNPDKDPVVINFRKKMKEIERKYNYGYRNEPNIFALILMFLFIIMLFVMMLQ